MQTQQTITKSPVHIKVAHNDEFRRFVLNPTTFENLKTTLRASFSLAEAVFAISFKDDENDWVLVATDEELEYAIELSGKPLRLKVLRETSSARPEVSPTEKLFVARGRGRGCQGGRGRDKVVARKGLKSREEKLSQKACRISERIDMLETKLNSNKFTSEREAIIRRKLAQLQENLAAIKSTQDTLPQETIATMVIPEPRSTETLIEEPEPESRTGETLVGEQEKPQCRGGRRGRGGRSFGRIGGPDRQAKKAFRSLVAPEIIENFRQCRARLLAARAAGNAEEIQNSLAAFQVAKAAKREAMMALRKDSQETSNDEQKA